MGVMLIVWSKKVCLVTIYHPEASQTNKYTMWDLYKEFSKLMSHYNIIKDEVIICGDFNIHVNKPDDPNTKKFMDILSQFNLVWHINEPTHKLGNTLDFTITRKTYILLNHKVDFQISDHNNILFQTDMQKPACPQKVVKFKKLKKVYMEELRKDIKETSDRGKTINDLVALVDHYNDELSRILDKHAPEEEWQVTLRKPTPWTSEDIRLEKQKRQRLERRWRKKDYLFMKRTELMLCWMHLV